MAVAALEESEGNRNTIGASLAPASASSRKGPGVGLERERHQHSPGVRCLSRLGQVAFPLCGPQFLHLYDGRVRPEDVQPPQALEINFLALCNRVFGSSQLVTSAQRSMPTGYCHGNWNRANHLTGPSIDYSCHWGKSGFCSKSGQRFPSFRMIELKDDDPQAIKQEFTKIHQKVDALLSSLEKEPAQQPERQEAPKGVSSSSSSSSCKDPLTNVKMGPEDGSSSGSPGHWA
uniref:Uncharacterized protein LOC110203349 n=1 Tax=Phascolarctos cinereus TaxID=38626 RepID=A0A6P5JVG5_PHACI|nr:uncharacterized protein LOC110203349 [Phascolarctos cinereus]